MERHDQVESRQRFVEAWNKTMIDIWQERITNLGVFDTGALFQSPIALPIKADGRFVNLELSQSFLEYGIWQDLGVGREVPHGNSGDLGRDKKRERRRWFSTKYYSSVLKLRDFMAESLGREFVGLVADLDASKQRSATSYYKQKKWS